MIFNDGPRRAGMPTPEAGAADSRPGPLFCQEGEYWTIGYDALVVRLRDARGLRYLAHLLRHPGERFESRDLLATVGGHGDETPNVERIRWAVTKRIKAAIRKIEEHHRALGYHLRSSIKTGHQCSYTPDPDHPVSWVVESDEKLKT